MKNYLLFAVTLFSLTQLSNAQLSGNQVYSNSRSSGNNYGQIGSGGGRSIQSTEQTVTITTNVLLNDVADSYMLTVGLNQEAETVLECNALINKRISNVLSKLKKLGIKTENSYVDFVTQTKVYDYAVGQSEAEQFQVGFEIKKNVNIHFEDVLLMDKIVEICAEEEIYDIINVEYLIDDINAIYERLMEEAFQLAEARKKNFEKYSSYEVSNKFRLISEDFNSIFPKTQYKQYEAKESSDLSVYNNRNQYVRKEMRKNRTFYYQGVPVNQYDKVIGLENPQIGVQHSLQVTIEYRLRVD